MRKIIYFFVSLVVWILLAWPFVDGGVDGQMLVAGVIASLLVAFLFHDILPKEHHVFISVVRVLWLLAYIPVFFYYVIKANVDVVYRALHPAMPINPGIVKVKTKLKSASGITALANSITLTPGTLTVDLTDDGYLYVHWINVKSDDIGKATEEIVEKFEYFLARIFE